jgi:hypothetical protein
MGPAEGRSNAVELEELAALPVAPRKGSRIGLPATLAVLAVVGLLASGFGLLGGRQDASTAPSGPSDVAIGASEPAPSPTLPMPSPLVTPNRGCAPNPEQAPGVLLAVDGKPTPGWVEVVTFTRDPPQAPAAPAVEIPADAQVEVWIDGNACALAWSIMLVQPSGNQVYPIAVEANPRLDPAYARQNRFDARLVQYRLAPGDLELRATLDFQGLRVQATWPIAFLPFDRPTPRLLLAGRDTYHPTVEGCDVVLTFRNGFEEDIPGCEHDISGPLPPAIALEPGAPLRLIFDGWTVTQAIAICGAASDLAFVTLPEPGCWQEHQGDVQFEAPKPGDWALGIAACAVDEVRIGDRICGTWYARVDTR